MTTKDALAQVLGRLDEERLREVLDFARFVGARDEQRAWSDLALEGLARAYGPEEPEYTKADIKEDASA